MPDTIEVELDGRTLAFLSRVSEGRDALGDALQACLERTPGRTFALFPKPADLAATNLYHFGSPLALRDDNGAPEVDELHVVHRDQYRRDVVQAWLGDQIMTDPTSALLVHDYSGSSILHDGLIAQTAPEWVQVVRGDATAHPSVVLNASTFEERFQDVHELMDFELTVGAAFGGWGELSGTVGARELAAHFRICPLLAVFAVAYDGDGFVCWEAL